jgi:hypothetical protein
MQIRIPNICNKAPQLKSMLACTPRAIQRVKGLVLSPQSVGEELPKLPQIGTAIRLVEQHFHLHI